MVSILFQTLMAKIRYSPLPDFIEFHKTRTSKKCVFGGLGSGKTTSLCYEILSLCNENKGLAGGIVCPTLKMFKRDVWPTFKEIQQKNNIRIKYRKSESELYIPHTDSTLYIFHGEDDGESIRGPNLAFMAINEVTLISLATYQAALGRVRLKKSTRLETVMSGTFEGNSELYDAIVEDKQCGVWYASSRRNPHLPLSYIKSIESSYDEDLVKQYIDGIPVVNMSKKALRKFDRNKHVADVKYNPDLPIWISLDFNVEPMSAVLWNRYSQLDGGPVLRAFKEYAIKDSSTSELAQQIKEEFDPKQCVIFPDPAGNSRSTKAHGTTDITLLEQAGFKDIRFKRAIPSVKDCLNATNNMLAKGLIVIDPSCKELIKDCERVELKPGTDIIDKSDNRRTHWLDGFKNMIDFEFPIKAMRGSWKEVKIR